MAKMRDLLAIVHCVVFVLPSAGLRRTRARRCAILAGFFFVQALNIVRIISLFYLGQWNYTVFEWFHLYLWPVLIMLDVLVVFAIYLQWLGKQRTEVTTA